jgi:glycosyltransferase involved in cell wall biosynthesis
LILFRDLAEVARTGVDWNAVAQFATRHCLRSFTYLALAITHQLAGGLVPEEFVAELRPPGFALRVVDRMIQRIDLTSFNGHRPHPLNLAIVLLHDQWSGRARLVLRAPFALFGWWGRVWRLRAAEDGPSAMIVVVGTHRRGAEVFGEQLARGLLASGWRCELVALTKSNGGSEVAAHPLSKLTDQRLTRLRLRLVLRLRRRLRTSGAQVVLANGSATLKYTVAALAGMRARPAFVYASVGEPSYWVTNSWRRIAQRYLLSRADLVVAVSGPTARQLVGDIGVAPERLMVAHTGVSSDLLTLPTRTPDEDLHVLVLGSLSTEKDPEAALAIFVTLRKTHRASLRFVGAGPLYDRLATVAIREALAGAVELVGSVSDVGPQLAWADVLLLTSRTEGLPGAVLEAAAAGVPAVGYAVGGVDEAIEHMQTGLVVPAGDQQAAVAALALLADDPELRLRLGQTARRRVARNFLLADAVTRYRKVQERAILTRRKQ